MSKWTTVKTHNRLHIYAVPVLANVGSDCDLCGGPTKGIVQSKRRNKFFIYERKLQNHHKISPRVLCGITLCIFRNY
jgi:hypothetical protein